MRQCPNCGQKTNGMWCPTCNVKTKIKAPRPKPIAVFSNFRIIRRPATLVEVAARTFPTVNASIAPRI